MRKPLIAIAALSCVGALALTGCSASEPSAAEPTTEFAEDGTFTIAVAQEFGTMNPYVEGQRFGYGLASFLYDSLLNFTADGDVQTGLAESWESTPSSVSFTLRDDVTCSSGEKLTATHVADVIAFNSDPANGSRQYGLRTSTVPSSVVADDAARTVTVNLDGEDGLLLYRLGELPIVCSEGFADTSILATQSDGTGPYVLDSVVAGDRYTLTKREGYAWGPDGATTDEPGMPQTVVMRIVADETTAANLLLSKEINVAKVTGRDTERLTAKGLTSVEEEIAGSWFALNQESTRVMNDIAVRTALVQATDTAKVIEVSGGGRGTEPTSLTVLSPKICAGDTPLRDVLPAYDVEAAKKTLESAGWVAGADGVRTKDGRRLTIDVVYPSQEHALNRVTLELLAEQWKAAGFEVVVEATDGSALTERVFVNGDYDVMVRGWAFGLPSQLVNYVSGPTPPDGLNIGWGDNPAYEAAAQKALSKTPPEACELWEEAQNILLENIDLVPVSNRVQDWFFQGGEAQMRPYNSPIPTSIRVYAN